MITSFGFTQGSPPANAKKVFDVRDLTHKTTDPAFDDRCEEILTYAKAHPGDDIAIGCVHGRHRSKLLADIVARKMATSVYHRDR